MKLVTAEEMRRIDEKTIQGGITGLMLMERAGEGVAREAVRMMGADPSEKQVIVVCGHGNNGGDGFVVGRLLSKKGARVEVYLVGDREKVKGDARVNLERILAMGLPVKEVRGPEDICGVEGADLIIDALFGTGIQGGVRGLAGEIIDFINEGDAPIVAVDLPSGLNADTGAVEGSCVRAAVTATMALPKRGLLLYPGREHAGEIAVVDIGVPDEVVAGENIQVQVATCDFVSGLLPHRASDVHKGACGRVLILAGSVGMTGAAALTSLATLRAGAGMALLGIPESLNDLMEIKLTEVMTSSLPETDKRSLSHHALGKIEELLRWSDVVALGPGLSTHHETVDLVHRLVPRLSVPAVIDADGLNALASRPELLSEGKRIVITPHPGELSRLIRLPVEEILSDRIGVARRVARELGVVVVLKGASSVIADVDGRAWVNPTGNAGMATAGSGDVLTGAIAGLLAQGAEPWVAAVVGVYLHGLAGDVVKMERGEMGLIAGDVLEALPRAIVEVQNSSFEGVLR